MTRGWTRGAWALRCVIAVGALGALLATIPAGATPSWWLILLVGGLAVGFAIYPESTMGIGVFALVIAWWGIGLRDGLHPAALAAAAGLLASHLAATVAAYGPGTVPPDPVAVQRWAVRGLVVLPAAGLAWLMATAARNQPEPPGIWAVGLAGLLVAIVTANVFYVRRPG